MLKEKGFKLEQILKYRVEIERVRTQEFVAARHNLDHAAEVLRQEQEALKDFKRQYRSCQESLESSEEIDLHEKYLLRKQNEIELQKQQVAELRAVLEHARFNMVEATKDRKVLDSLKEKKVKEFRQYLDQREQLFLDEISVQKTGKGS